MKTIVMNKEEVLKAYQDGIGIGGEEPVRFSFVAELPSHNEIQTTSEPSNYSLLTLGIVSLLMLLSSVMFGLVN